MLQLLGPFFHAHRSLRWCLQCCHGCRTCPEPPQTLCSSYRTWSPLVTALISCYWGSTGCADVGGKQSRAEETSTPFSLTGLMPSMLFSPFAQLLEGCSLASKLLGQVGQ